MRTDLLSLLVLIAHCLSVHTPAPAQGPPLPAQDSPLSAQGSRLAQDSRLPAQDSPLPAQGSPLPVQKAQAVPIERVAAPRLDVSKRMAELPLRRLIPVHPRLTEQNGELKSSSSRPTGAGAASTGNPKTEPGKVKWHATLEQALAASRKSFKPVMLFQMLGRLDDRFC